LTGKSWKNMNVEKYKRLETFHPSTWMKQKRC
jgi:hypothetical protein